MKLNTLVSKRFGAFLRELKRKYREASRPRVFAACSRLYIFEALLERYYSLSFSRDVFARLAA